MKDIIPIIPIKPYETKQSNAVAAAIELPEEELVLTHNSHNETAANDNSYPTGKVIINYLLFGGPIGGSFIGLLLMIASARFDLSYVLGGSAVGFIFGLIPATLTGFLIASFKLNRDFKGLLWSAIIGAGITFNLTNVIGSTISMLLILTVIGAFSAILTGLFTLPKPSNNI